MSDDDLPPTQSGAPLIEMDRSTGEFYIGWPEGKPETVTLPTDGWESIYYWHNRMMRLIRLQHAAIATLDAGMTPPRRMRQEIDDLRKELQIP